MIQTAAIGISAVVLAVQMKALRPEYSMYLILAAGIAVAVLGVSRLELILDTVAKIESHIQVENAYIGTLLKMVGIAYLAEFSSGLCKDAGFSSLGIQIEMFAKLSMLALSCPVVLAILETLKRFVS